MEWQFNTYDLFTHSLWGWGYHNNQIWEFMGKWHPHAHPPGLEITWVKHPVESDSRRQMWAAERVLDHSINQRTFPAMEKLIPNFEHRLITTFIYAKMEQS
jgi:hypothetical protein